MCFGFLSTFPNLPVSLRNTYPLRNKINQICAWASRPFPAHSPGIPLVTGISSHQLPPQADMCWTPRIRPRNSQARLLLTGGLPRLPTQSRQREGSSGQRRGRQRVWTGRSWGEPSESGLPSWDTVMTTHKVRSREGSWQERLAQKHRVPGE